MGTKHGINNYDPLETRLWQRVTKGDGDACWLWFGPVSKGGYGNIVHRGKWYRVHRLSWALAFNGGVLPSSSTVIMHTCDVRTCVNPAHLQLGTHTTNHADMVAKGRNAKGDKVSPRTRANAIRRRLGFPER